MHKLAMALAAALALASPVLAQDAKPPKGTEEPKKADEAKKGPVNPFFKGQTVTQVLAKDRLLGAKVLGKDDQVLGTVEDLIISGAQIDGIILNTGDKKIGIRIAALKITTLEGDLTIVMPAGTKDAIKGVAPYQRANVARKK